MNIGALINFLFALINVCIYKKSLKQPATNNTAASQLDKAEQGGVTFQQSHA